MVAAQANSSEDFGRNDRASPGHFYKAGFQSFAAQIPPDNCRKLLDEKNSGIEAKAKPAKLEGPYL